MTLEDAIEHAEKEVVKLEQNVARLYPVIDSWLHG